MSACLQRVGEGKEEEWDESVLAMQHDIVCE